MSYYDNVLDPKQTITIKAPVATKNKKDQAVMQTKSGLQFEFLPSVHPVMVRIDSILNEC